MFLGSFDVWAPRDITVPKMRVLLSECSYNCLCFQNDSRQMRSIISSHTYFNGIFASPM